MQSYSIRAMLDPWHLTDETPDGRISFAVNDVIKQLKTTYSKNENSLEYANKLVMASNREVLNFLQGAEL